jgi:hypothetical protein
MYYITRHAAEKWNDFGSGELQDAFNASMRVSPEIIRPILGRFSEQIRFGPTLFFMTQDRGGVFVVSERDHSLVTYIKFQPAQASKMRVLYPDTEKIEPEEFDPEPAQPVLSKTERAQEALAEWVTTQLEPSDTEVLPLPVAIRKFKEWARVKGKKSSTTEWIFASALEQKYQRVWIAKETYGFLCRMRSAPVFQQEEPALSQTERQTRALEGVHTELKRLADYAFSYKGK